MNTIEEDLDVIKGTGTIADPLTNIRGLAFAQNLAAQRNREYYYRSISEQAQPQDEETLHGHLSGPLRYIGEYGIGISGTLGRGVLEIPAGILGGFGAASSKIFGGESSLTRAGKQLDDWGQSVKNAANDTYTAVAGIEPTKLDNILHTSGTSSASWLLGLLGYGLAAASGVVSPVAKAMIGYGTRNLMEAAMEAGNSISDLYAQDKTRYNDALLAGAYSFGINAPLDALQGVVEGGLEAGLEYILPVGGNIAWRLGRDYVKGLVKEEANELTQEPRQQAVEEAVKKTFESGDMSFGNYLSNLYGETKRLPQHFNDVAEDTAWSTLITHTLMWPLGLGGSEYRENDNQSNNRRQLSDEEIEAMKLNKLKELQSYRDNLQGRINSSYLAYNGTLEDALNAEKEVQAMQNELDAVNDAIANFWQDTGVVTNPVQDDDINLFPEGSNEKFSYQTQTPIISTNPTVDAANTESSIPTIDELVNAANPTRDYLPDEQQMTIDAKQPIPFEGYDVQTSEISTSDRNAPNLTPLTALNVQLTQNTAAVSGNTARVRTMRGTEADIRYKVIEADDLITSNKDNGAINPEYPQELQPRQRNRDASIQQISKISNQLDPELLGENRLASDGAPIIGNDNVVESGNGRVMGIRQAYKFGRGESYRAWIQNNASRFGLNPDEISKFKNPVLVRERISDVDRVKFTSEANESSIAQKSATEQALDDARKITPELLSYYDPNVSLAGNHKFITAFGSTISQNERGDFIQSDGRVSKAGIDRVQNALLAKAYNDTGILNRLNEIYDDEIKNVSNALINAAPKMALFENSGHNPEISLRDDISKAIQTLAQIKREGGTVDSYLNQVQMFNDNEASPEVKKLLRFFDKNKRSTKKISQGLIHYADSAMNEARQGQVTMFEDSVRTKGQILDEAIRYAETGENESYNQSDNTRNVGNIQVEQNGQRRNFKVVAGEYSEKHEKHKKYVGRYLDIQDENGRTVARYAPYTKKLQMADIQDAAELRPQVEADLRSNYRRYLEKAGFLDENGKLKSDGNEEYRRQYRNRADTTPEGKTLNPKNVRQDSGEKLKDTRSFFRRVFDSLGEKHAFHQVQKDIKNKIQHIRIDGTNEEINIREDAAEYISKTTAATLQATAHAAGMSINDLYEVANLNIVAQETNEARNGNTTFIKPHYEKDSDGNYVRDKNGNRKVIPAQTLVTFYGKWQYRHDENGNPQKTYFRVYANVSTALHEFALGHTYLDIMREVMQLDNISEQRKQDWVNLLKWLGVSDIDLTRDSSEWTQEERDRWRNAHEKFAAASEQYFATGQAPKSWLKRAFEAFKRWLSDIYGVIRNIRYAGTDNWAHEVELKSKTREIFDRMFEDTHFVPNAKNTETMKARAGLLGEEALRKARNLQTNTQFTISEAEAWSNNVDKVLNGEIGEREHVKVMDTPKVFELIGANSLLIYMDAGKINKILDKHPAITPEIIKQIPYAITDPIAIFKSATHPNDSIVVMTEIMDEDGGTVIVPVHLDAAQDGYTINRISSIFAKKDDKTGQVKNDWFIEQVNNGRLLYLNNKKGSRWSDQTRLQLPVGSPAENIVRSIPNENDLAKLLQGGNTGSSETYFQPPLNGDVDLGDDVKVVKVDATLDNVPFWQRMKAFGKEKRQDILNRFKNGNVVNEHTGLTITLSNQGLNHILDTARDNDNVAGEIIYQSIPYLDKLAQNAYRVETHGDRKPSATKIAGQKGNLRQVHRFLVPVSFNGNTHILKLTAKEYETGKTEINEVSLYDMKHAKKMSVHPSQNSPNLMGRAAGTIGNPDTISVRDMLRDVNDVEGKPYTDTSESYDQIIGEDGARRLDEQENTTLRMDNLNIAKQMERDGLPAKKMWFATGWTRGNDGKWRMELPDGKLTKAFRKFRVFAANPKQATEYEHLVNKVEQLVKSQSLNMTIDELQERGEAVYQHVIDTLPPKERKQYLKLTDIVGNATYLGSVLDAPELFKAYPELLEVSIIYEDLDEDLKGTYNPDENAIFLNLRYLNDIRGIRSTMLHEIQHKIQEIEGFASGATPDMFKEQVNSEGKINTSPYLYANARRQQNLIFDSLTPELQETFWKLHKRQKELPQKSFERLLSKTLSKNDAKRYTAWANALEQGNFFQLRDIFLNGDDDTAYSLYRATAGEVEARNVQNRMNWGEKRRRSTSLEMSEDNSAPREYQPTFNAAGGYTFDSREDGFITSEMLEHFDQLAYTGTGNIIFNNKFDMRYKGSNEGAAMFGHGAYLAENPEVAETYRHYGLPNGGRGIMHVHMADGYEYLFDGKKIFDARYKSSVPDKRMLAAFDDIQRRFGDIDIQNSSKVLKSLKKFYKDRIAAEREMTGRNIQSLQERLNIVNSIKSFEFTDAKKGNIYTFDVPENEDLLDWDATLEEQPEKIRASISGLIDEMNNNPGKFIVYGFAQLAKNPKTAEPKLKRIFDALSRKFLDRYIDNYAFRTLPEYKQLRSILQKEDLIDDFKRAINKARRLANKLNEHSSTGEDLYWALSDLLGSDENASMYLNSLGIPGHRYFDGMSRDAKEGTHNFVIWNMNKLKMLGVVGDPEAEEYFKHTQSEQQGNGESYNQPALGRQNSIRDVLDVMQTEQGQKNSGQVWVDYARILPSEAKRISDATGLEINDQYVHTLIGSAITHVEKRHGVGNEKWENQLPITDTDYERIPDIIKNADEIRRGTDKTTGNINDTIVYQKRINGHVLIVEEVRKGRKKLAFHTMRKAKAGYVYDLSHEGQPIVKEKAKSEGVNVRNDFQPEAELPNALSNAKSLADNAYNVNGESYGQSANDTQQDNNLDILSKYSDILERVDPNNIDFNNLAKDNDGFMSDKEAERYNQLGWQGTGHILEGNRIDFGKVGTGEGNASFGWGAYFAQAKSVAQHYRKYGKKAGGTLIIHMKDGTIYKSSSFMHDDGEAHWGVPEIDDGDNDNYNFPLSSTLYGIENYLRDAMEEDPDADMSMSDIRNILADENECVERLRKKLEQDKYFDPFLKKLDENALQATLERIEVLKNISNVGLDPTKGNIYQFDLPENDVLLDWDATLKNQPEHVKKAIKKINQTLESMSLYSSKLADAKTGQEFYKALTELLALHNNDERLYSWARDKRYKKQTSMLFNKFGVPGLRFFDGMSRKKQEGTHNFVIWNSDMAKLIGITPDSDQDAIDYFNAERERQQAGAESYSQSENIRQNIIRGNEAMNKVINEHTDVMDAMYRDDLGDISFVWGEPGRGKKFKGGKGVSHIIAHRNAQGYDGEAIARKMVDVIANGNITRRYGENVPYGTRVDINYDGHTAVLSLFKDRENITWLLTGFKNENPDASGEGNGSTSATLSEPMRTRPEEGAGNFASSLAGNSDNVNNTNSFITDEQLEKYDQLMLHGTPNILNGNKFNLEYIGTGEGIQAFGYGIYLAQEKDVANSYRTHDRAPNERIEAFIKTKEGKTLSPDQFEKYLSEKSEGTYGSVLHPIMFTEYMLGVAQGKYKSIDDAINHLVEDGKKTLAENFADINDESFISRITAKEESRLRKIAEQIAPIEVTKNPDFKQGNVYSVDGPEDIDLLDWDATMREQSEKVLNAIRNSDVKIHDNETGEHFYKRLSKKLGGDKNASMWLNDLGIPGHRYFDGGSRKQKNGTHNFVIWNTDTLRVLGIEGDEDAEEYFRAEDYNNARLDALDNDSDNVEYSSADFDNDSRRAEDYYNAYMDGLDNSSESYNQSANNEQIYSENFKRFFGDWENDPQNASKIVDKNGRPRVVYHATGKEDFSIFQSGNSANIIYFAFTKTGAKKAARAKSKIMECYLNVRNPVNSMDNPMNWYDAEDYLKVDKWRRQGYDGVFVRDEAGISVAVFNPTQIKSVENNGDFDVSNPDIYYQSEIPQDNPFIERYSQKYTFDNPATEKAFKKSREQEETPKGKLAEINHSLRQMINGLRGDFPELATKKAKAKGLIYAREVLRKMGRVEGAKTWLAVQSLSKSLKGMNADQLDTFTRLFLINDIYNFKRYNPKAKLPMGFTAESLKAEREKFTRIAQNDHAIMDAVRLEHEAHEEIKKELSGLAEELGMKKFADKVRRFDYYILDYVRLLGGNGINANYIQAAGEYRTAQLKDIEHLQAIKALKDSYDKKDELIKKFGKDWKKHIPKGYEVFNPLKQQFVTSAHTLTENILGMALEQAGQEWGLSEETLNSLREKLSDNTDAHLLVLPEELTNTLNKMAEPPKPRGPLYKIIKLLTGGWKQHVLYSPTRVIKYNLRNITGDADAAIAGNPQSLLYLKRAIGDLSNLYFGNSDEVSKELREFQKRGGAITIESTQELGDYKEIREFRNLISELEGKDASFWSKLSPAKWKLIDKYMSKVTKFSDFREQWLRFANYLSYVDQMEKNNGVPSNWGASVKEEVMSLPDIRDRAFKMSNELLGAYDQVSETGKALRDTFLPFYSWIEVNAKRYYQLIKNGLTEDNAGDFASRFLKGQLANAPYYAFKLGKTYLLINLFSMLCKLWNLLFPETEDELPPDIKEKPHINLGHDPFTGDALYFDRVGALLDNLEWFGQDNSEFLWTRLPFYRDAKDILDGRQTFTDFAQKLITAPIDKTVNAITPFIKTPMEILTGKSIYPSAMNPRSIRDGWQYLAQSLGLNWPYKAATGQPYSNWDEFRNLFVYGADADEAAYFYSLNLVRQFQEQQLGKKTGSFATTKRGQALQRLKTALRLDDKDAVQRYLQEYYRLGGDAKGLKASMRNMNPLHGLSKNEQSQFLKWISDDDRKYLNRANKFFHRIADRFLK